MAINVVSHNLNKYTRYSVIILFMLAGCSKNNPGEHSCIKVSINDFSKNSCASGSSVEEYSFQDRLVYVFSPGNCGGDLSADVMDSNCTSLGFLGGFMGNTKINGVEFSTAIYKRTLWSR